MYILSYLWINDYGVQNPEFESYPFWGWSSEIIKWESV